MPLSKRDLKYMLILGGTILLFVGLEVFGPKPVDWTITYHGKDKNPYGNYVMQEQFHDIFSQPVSSAFTSFYEWPDTAQAPVNHLILCNYFNPGNEDINALLSRVESGDAAFIAARGFQYKFADTLGFTTKDFLSVIFNMQGDERLDSIFLKFDEATLPQVKDTFSYSSQSIPFGLEVGDTIAHKVLARDQFDNPVLIYLPWGEGKIFISSTPLAFTNIYMLQEPNELYFSSAMSLLPDRPVIWWEYYHLGRMEAASPLRFILTNEPLKWAYYVGLLSLVIFMVFEAKRRQRIIPVVTPLTNQSMMFVKTIGNLYLNRSAHKSVADKMISFFLEGIRSKYYLKTDQLNDDFYHQLSRKSGRSLETIKSLFYQIKNIQQRQRIAPEDIIKLRQGIDTFNNQA